MSLQEAFKGKRVIITGAGRGLGRALVKRLDSYGAIVYAVSKNPDNLSTLKDECPNVNPVPVDLSDWNATRTVLSTIDRVDCLVNNASVYIGGNCMELNGEDFDRVMSVNVKGLMNVSQVVAGKMIKAGKPGVIVNVTSGAGRKAHPTTGWYTISKAAQEHITKCLAIELGPHKIRVNTVCPACFESDMYTEFSGQKGHEGIDQMVAQATPLGIVMMPIEDIINTTLFLLSDLTSTITGESVAVDGGYLVR